MFRNNKILFSIVVFMGLVIIALLAAYIFIPAPDRSDGQSQSDTWAVYRSDKYGFEIKYPPDWTVAVDEEFEPKINIYKKDETTAPPFIHHHNVTQVSIFPKGIGTEGVDGETVPSDIDFLEVTAQSIDFLLEDGARWGTYATFENRPPSWESFGFVWASARIEDSFSECVLNGEILPMERCDLGVDRPAGANIVLRGKMDPAERDVEKQILETFRFLRGENGEN